ncbi:hypothetical protein [Pedobacter sp. KLB.chiD]|uniref:hypothetical protein n=1 Tax=Pedobacter sp. KLB.chiD TaxID=3387402 RepID=UPI00399AA428
MNIDQIENDLNNHEVDPILLLNQILSSNIKNQAINEVILEMQTQLLKSIDPSIDFDTLAKQQAERIEKRVSEIQAELSSRF